jgi:hypothetical protein
MTQIYLLTAPTMAILIYVTCALAHVAKVQANSLWNNRNLAKLFNQCCAPTLASKALSL